MAVRMVGKRSGGALSALLCAAAGTFVIAAYCPGAVAQTSPGLDSPDAGARVQAVFAVRSAADRSALPKLAELVMADPHKGVRLFATMALGELGGPEHIPVLEQVIARDPDADVRAAAETAKQQILARPAAAPVAATPAVAAAPVVPAASAYATPAYAAPAAPAAPALPAPAPAVPAAPAYVEPVAAPTAPTPAVEPAPAYAAVPGAPAYPPPGAPAYPTMSLPGYAAPAIEQPAAPQSAAAAPGYDVPAVPLQQQLPIEEKQYGDAGTFEISGIGSFGYESNDDTKTQSGVDLIRNTSTTKISLDTLTGYYLAKRFVLLGMLGLQLDKVNTSNDTLGANNKVETAHDSTATNDVNLDVGAGYLFPLADKLFLEAGVLAGVKYRVAQLSDDDRSGLGWEGRGLAELRYALSSRVQVLATLQAVYGARRLTDTPVGEGKSYDVDQTTFDVNFGVGLSTWF